MKQTTLQWLIHQIIEDKTVKAKSLHEWRNILERAIQMHKDEIVDAFRYGNSNEILGKKHPEDYYNDTFTK